MHFSVRDSVPRVGFKKSRVGFKNSSVTVSIGFVFRIAISVFLILLVASSMLGGRRADVLGLHRGLLSNRQTGSA